MLVRLNPGNGEFEKNPIHETDMYNRRIQGLKRSIARMKTSIKANKGNVEALKKKLAKDEEILKNLKKPESEIAFALGSGGRGSEGLINWNWPRLGNRKYVRMNYGNFDGDLVS